MKIPLWFSIPFWHKDQGINKIVKTIWREATEYKRNLILERLFLTLLRILKGKVHLVGGRLIFCLRYTIVLVSLTYLFWFTKTALNLRTYNVLKISGRNIILGQVKAVM